MAAPPAEPSIRDQMVDNQKVIDSLNNKLARKTDEVRIIQQISSEISSTLDLDRILAISLDAMEAVLGFRHSMILLASADERTLKVAASRGYDGNTGAEIAVGQGVLGVAARRWQVLRMGNVASQRAYLAGVRARTEAAGAGTLAPVAEMPGLANAQSQLAIPLVVKNRLVGVLGVESERASGFDELDEMLLSIVGNQIATGIDNAQMHLNAIEHSRKLDAVNAELLHLNQALEAGVAARTAELSSALDQVSREKDLSESLLRRMAPSEVIPLMLEDKLVARRLDVTVMFTDIVDFTAYSAGMEPDEVFSQLNDSSVPRATSSGAIAATSTRRTATASWRCSASRSRASPTAPMPYSRRWRCSARSARTFLGACASASTAASSRPACSVRPIRASTMCWAKR
jgi:GAF domain-containing protein